MELTTIILLFSLLFSFSTSHANEAINTTKKEEQGRLSLIKQRGTLIVGVKNDYPPWGFYDEKGKLIGLEIDLAQDLADRFNVDLQLQVVNSSNRIGKLEQGAIDVIIATMADTRVRRQQTGILEPSYYSSGASIVVPETSNLKSWAELYGRSVCLTKNAYFNRDLTERFLLKAQEYKGTLDNMAALKFGKCTGWIYDDTALTSLLHDPQWQDFKTPLPSILVTPWAVAVKQTEQFNALGLAISDAIIDWHRTGKILSLEKKWNIKHSQFIIDQNNKWNQQSADGTFICRRKDDGSFPILCLNRKSIGATEALKDNTLSRWGIDFPPAYDPYSLNILIKGIAITLLLSIGSIVGSLLFGLLIGLTLFRSPLSLRWLFNGINNI